MGAPDVVIAGAGVVGASCARALAGSGLAVAVLDPDSLPGAATVASAGLLPPLVEARADDPLLGLSIRARDLYTELAPALAAETGRDIGLWTEGILQVAFSEAEANALMGGVAWQRQQGYHAEWLSRDELKEMAPGITPAALGAALAAEDGMLDPVALRDALLQSAVTRGATVARGEPVEGVVIENHQVVGVRTPAGTRSAGALVIAAGCWSGRINRLPRPLSVEPVRGQMVAFPWPEGEPTAVLYGGGGYVLRRGGEALAGATVEFAGFDSSVTDDGIAQVTGLARRMYPALERASPARMLAGLRPGTPDGHPFIGRDPVVTNLFYATGHGRHGILLAAITGEIIAGLWADQPSEFDLSPMAPGRFWAT
ncbi:MAG TPA: glycine oxidase ThiO [Gemmatimonadales bacterium]|nr:glycine oxidase ThiO [Gemmatimonadales bacterium]